MPPTHEQRPDRAVTESGPGEPPVQRESVSIIVPTFQEAANIPMLVERVHAALLDSGIEWELLLVDDNSGDGSEAIVEGWSRRLPVRMEVRRGLPPDLSLAVLHGIRHSRFGRLVVMDADLSHPPESILDLLRTLDADCDMAVGSRYVPGGGVDRAWSLRRFLTSRLATLLTRPLVRCADPMSGFFAIDRRALPNPDTLRPVGYKIGLELMVRGRLRIKETPIGFRDRYRGSSKMNWRRQIDYLRHLYRLYTFRYGGLVRLLSFGVVGASGLAVDVACYLLLVWAGMEHRLARFLSFWPAVSWNWLLNRKVTFGDRVREPHLRQWAKFVTVSLVGLTANVGSYAALTSLLDVFDRHRLLTFLIGVALGAVFNFLLSTLYVYREHAARLPGSERAA